jgi:hypothetical protein
MIEHDVEDVMRSVFGNAKGKTVAIPQSYFNAIQVASGRGHPKSTVESYTDTIEWTDEPANVNINGIDPVVLPIPVFIVASPKPVTQEIFPDFDKEGFWESQGEYANRINCCVGTLRKYRETDSGVAWSKCGTLGKDKHGNIFRRENGKSNSSYLYFVRSDASDRK